MTDKSLLCLVFALTIVQNEVSDNVWGSYVPQALANGTLKCKPDPLVVGQGVDRFQAAVDKLKEGVSAKKLIVELP